MRVTVGNAIEKKFIEIFLSPPQIVNQSGQNLKSLLIFFPAVKTCHLSTALKEPIKSSFLKGKTVLFVSYFHLIRYQFTESSYVDQIYTESRVECADFDGQSFLFKFEMEGLKTVTV